MEVICVVTDKKRMEREDSSTNSVVSSILIHFGKSKYNDFSPIFFVELTTRMTFLLSSTNHRQGKISFIKEEITLSKLNYKVVYIKKFIGN
jgi:hypothetical protein